jgi:MFS family permease
MRVYRESLAALDPRARLVALASAVFIAARMSTVTFLAVFFVQERGLPAPLVGAALFLESLSRGLVAPLAGALSDRLGRRPLLLATVALTALVLPAFLLVRTPATLFAWSALVGLAQGPYFALSSSLLLDLVPPERRQSALAVNYTAISIGFTVGVAPAGFLAERGYGWLAAGSCVGALLVGAIYLAALRGPLPTEAPGARTTLAADTVRALRDRRFLAFALLALVFPLGIGLVTAPIALYAVDAGVSAGALGLVLSLNGLLVILLALPVNARIERSGPRRWLPLSAALCAACYLALVPGGTVAWLLAAVVLFSLAEILFSSAVPAAVAALAPAGHRGAYQGAWGLLFASSAGAAALLAGLGRDRIGWRWTWALAALVTLAAGVGLWRRAAIGARDPAADLAAPPTP